jgi:hypothetical protein
MNPRKLALHVLTRATFRARRNLLGVIFDVLFGFERIMAVAAVKFVRWHCVSQSADQATRP